MQKGRHPRAAAPLQLPTRAVRAAALSFFARYGKPAQGAQKSPQARQFPSRILFYRARAEIWVYNCFPASDCACMCCLRGSCIVSRETAEKSIPESVSAAMHLRGSRIGLPADGSDGVPPPGLLPCRPPPGLLACRPPPGLLPVPPSAGAPPVPPFAGAPPVPPSAARPPRCPFAMPMPRALPRSNASDKKCAPLVDMRTKKCYNSEKTRRR